ncbi:unnamed protein product [Didymodactylos carnosus]|uniref:S1-like domain-containing protein n=1 Tax=Didymodactylos carnosus TaxID=1234261 RepID=A0A814D1T0_9BILA|nr:unnamed protein product [Didymodactylos carnosus]CAF0948105.1 unnamed protein product [Didymodactylos carnosus]CAF3684807.1 unnamed protein product [Didymodactylos carnosus]CAF3724087.1 unnamed protein product [Didymodactylos carnosus]
MPKNKGKGGKNRRRGKNENDDIKRELITKDEGQSYAQVTRILGNGHLEAFCFDMNTGGKKRLCHIRGKLRKKVWINQGDIILVGLRDYQDDKADVIMKYLADEARELKRIKAIPDNINITETSTFTAEGLEEVVFDERYNAEGSSGGEPESGPDEDLEGDDDDEFPFQKSGNLNQRNLIAKKDTGKGARNDRRKQRISDSDSGEDDEVGNI